MADKNLVYGECIVCGREDTMNLTDAQKAVYDALRESDADLGEYKTAFPEFNAAQCAFLWAGLCPQHS